MATIINNTRPNDRVVEVDRSDNSAGWAVAVVILLLVIAGGVWAYARYYRGAAPAPSGDTNVNVTLPAIPGASSGDTNTGGTPSPVY